MKIVIINKSDSTGGAAIVSRRLGEALRAEGEDVSMIVNEKLTSFDWIHQAAGKRAMMVPFVKERLRIWIAEGFRRKNLFKADIATDGLPLHRNPLVREADIVVLGWVNQGLISLKEVAAVRDMGKPIVWIMHDMWSLTGICHHAGDCSRYRGKCGKCRLLSPLDYDSDLSRSTWLRKRKLYSVGGITFVPVSSWLEGKCRESSLLKDMPLVRIPNPFPIADMPQRHESDGRYRLLFGAARLDDPIKDLPTLLLSLSVFAEKYPELAKASILTTFGGLRDENALADIAISHRHLGIVRGEENLRQLYAESDVVLSTSLFETLPGTLVEGEAYGALPVSFDRGGQRDIVTDGVTGFLVPFDDDRQKRAEAFADRLAEALRQLSRDGAGFRSRMRSNVEKRFSSRSVARDFITLFNKLKQ